MPGPRTTSVRRTVLVAVSLVTGQALLGGVIGFVTFDRDDETTVASRAADPVAAPPAVAPAPSVPAPEGSSRPPRKRPAAAVSTTIRRTPPPAGTQTSEPATGRPRTPAPAESSETSAPEPVPPAPPPTSSPAPPALMPPEYDLPPDEDVPVVGERCEEEGATGRTGDGKAVRCERNRDGDLRWRPV